MTHHSRSDEREALIRKAAESQPRSQAVASLLGGWLSLMKLFASTGRQPPAHSSEPFVCLSSWALLSARLCEDDINIFISLTLGGQVELLQMTSP